MASQQTFTKPPYTLISRPPAPPPPFPRFAAQPHRKRTQTQKRTNGDEPWKSIIESRSHLINVKRAVVCAPMALPSASLACNPETDTPKNALCVVAVWVEYQDLSLALLLHVWLLSRWLAIGRCLATFATWTLATLWCLVRWVLLSCWVVSVLLWGAAALLDNQECNCNGHSQDNNDSNNNANERALAHATTRAISSGSVAIDTQLG